MKQRSGNLTPSGIAVVRLTLDVTYDLNGECATEMVRRLRKACERAIGEGMLTGETAAEVDTYSIDAVIQPEPLTDHAAMMNENVQTSTIQAQ